MKILMKGTYTVTQEKSDWRYFCSFPNGAQSSRVLSPSDPHPPRLSSRRTITTGLGCGAMRRAQFYEFML